MKTTDKIFSFLEVLMVLLMILVVVILFYVLGINWFLTPIGIIIILVLYYIVKAVYKKSD